MKTTRKKTRIIGKETFINRETGELVEMNVIQIEERDCNFHKLWLGHIVQTLDIIGNKKIKVVNFIMEHLTNDNLFIQTQREMEKEMKISIKTINETIRALQDSDFLTRIQSGVYRINPEVIFKGTKDNRLNVLIMYRNEREKSNQEEEKRINQEKDEDHEQETRENFS